MSDDTPRMHAVEAALYRLDRRVAELEAELALLRGTLAHEPPDIPTQITHDVPPSAPR